MAAESRIPAMAPTTHAAPKLARVMPALIRLSAGAGKPLASHGIASLAEATCLLPPCVFRRVRVSALAVRPQHSGKLRLPCRLPHLGEVNPANWSKGLFDAFALRNPPFKRVPVDAADQAPFRERVRLAIAGEVATDAAVVRLHDTRSPSAIRRLVISVVVDAIKRHLWFRLAHVSEKVLEGQPSVTDDDASSSVFIEMLRVRIEAPLFHSEPNGMNARPGHAVRHIRPVKCRRSRRTSATVFAATGDRAPRPEMVTPNALLSPAVALHEQVAPLIGNAAHCQQAKARSGFDNRSLGHNPPIASAADAGNMSFLAYGKAM